MLSNGPPGPAIQSAKAQRPTSVTPRLRLSSIPMFGPRPLSPEQLGLFLEITTYTLRSANKHGISGLSGERYLA
jgi:hypothetical protein